jgi:hypothetical protein
MASFKCPHCGSLQTIPLEEFAPGFVGAPALFLGCVFGALSRHNPQVSSEENLIPGLVFGLPIGIGVLLWYLANHYVLKCGNCGFLTRGLKKKG